MAAAYRALRKVADDTGERGEGHMADFLETVLSEAEPVTTPEAEPVIEAPAVEPVAEVATEPMPPAEAVAQPEVNRPEPGYVPISALMDERDKRKAAEARAQQYAPQPQQQVVPDPLDDPQGYNTFLEQRLATAMTEQRFSMSAEMAKQQHGEAMVEAAANWAAERAQSDPVFRASWQQALQGNPHPLNWVIQQHKRSERDAALGEASLDDWFISEAAKRGYTLQAAPVAAAPIVAAAPQAPRPVAPPRSIASEVSTSAPVATDSKAEFEAIFNGR